MDYLHEGDPNWGWEFRCEDFVFARLDEERKAAEGLTGAAREAALARVEGLRVIAGWHSMYVDEEGRSAARCFTCERSLGVPCVTMCGLASMWRGHEDCLPGWAKHGAFLADVIAAGGFRRAFLAKQVAS